MTRIKIDLMSGVIDVEGEESFVREIYAEYKERLQTIAAKPPASKTPNVVVGGETVVEKKAKAIFKSNGKRKKESYSFVKDLDLSSRGGKQSLKEFHASKAPSTAYERDVVFTYYLQKIKEIENITPDHIYTCFKDIPGISTPVALMQNLRECSTDKGWLDASNTASIVVSIKGENFVENDLPAPSAKSDK